MHFLPNAFVSWSLYGLDFIVLSMWRESCNKDSTGATQKGARNVILRASFPGDRDSRGDPGFCGNFPRSRGRGKDFVFSLPGVVCRLAGNSHRQTSVTTLLSVSLSSIHTLTRVLSVIHGCLP